MSERDIEERAGLTVCAAAAKQIAEDVVGLDWRASLDIAQHRAGEGRAWRGEHWPRPREKFRGRREALRSRDRGTLVQERRGEIGSARRNDVTDRGVHQGGDPGAGSR